MATTKKRTKVQKEKRAKLLNEVAGINMMSSSTVNCNIIKSLHKNTDFGENEFGEKVEMDIKSLTEMMNTISDQVKSGNLSNLEEMLVCQAYSLQHMFMNMVCKVEMTTNADHIELLSRLALKAQNQCRTTIATLAEMKNPKRATFIKQLNQANQLQVNNDESKNPKKNTISANKQLEQTDGERLDTRTTSKAIGANQDLETVGEVNRG